MNIRLVWIFLMLVFLAGCSSSPTEYDPTQEPTRVTISMLADEKVNPNSSGEATPIEFTVFELEDDSMFMSADYEQLIEDFKAALSSNYIDNYDYVLLPSQFKFIESIEIDEDTNYIGVMVSYSDPDTSQWKKVVKVKPLGRDYHLLTLFKENEVILEKVE
ncbi:type VI secretion system lipoprotein TssJ [Marinomonas sp. MED121]|uniref:type VI secretion system lipoprotein TssJ n=1 Tax=Marinomonas sp. MED121 TaxID=314277 RepID=UPI0002EDFFA5|nr:type VI secretion system lipoprotein TssJ [Marinomonas sp. MED121]